jgi:phosphoribosylformylglycinamidine synthase subunit PurQ / glutaminase
MRIAIIQFPGSNCERETILAVKRAGMQPVEFLWNQGAEQLNNMDAYIIVGGFSYEDRSRAGIIAALDPIMQTVKVQSEKGKPVLGICNGAQILVETGLVPGVEHNKTVMVLAENKRMAQGKILGTGYYNAWINMRLSDHHQRNAFTKHLSPKDILHVPVAHAEGRFVMSKALLQEIENQGQNIFQYCDAAGQIIDAFPVNPNGSLHNIAAISNKAGNVMALMPHPERTINGDKIFQSMRDYIADGSKMPEVTSLYYYPRRSKLSQYQAEKAVKECIVELMISDNQALTVQQTLQQLGIPVEVKRQVHWEITAQSPAAFAAVGASGVLYNERKELRLDAIKPCANTASFLVRTKEDLHALQALQTLRDHFSIQGIDALSHGIVWHFTAINAKIADLIEPILQTNIIANPYAHDCYCYEPTLS